ncbi:MAG: site-specific integrase [Ferrimonas sp.]
MPKAFVSNHTDKLLNRYNLFTDDLVRYIKIFMLTPYFDGFENYQQNNAIISQQITQLTLSEIPDAALVYELTIDYLSELSSVPNNWKSARSEINLLLIWCWQVEKISIKDLTRRRLQDFLNWCAKPKSELIGPAPRPMFLSTKDPNVLPSRYPNPAWRPFIHRQAKHGAITDYVRAHAATKQQLVVLSGFFTYLNDEDYMDRNAAGQMLRRLSKNRTHLNLDEEKIKALNNMQIEAVFQILDRLAEKSPEEHERTRWLIYLMYSTYPRISEISGRIGYSPNMSQIRRDRSGETWGFFIPMSKNGQARTIAVSDALLGALKRYRGYLGLSPLPFAKENTPLIPRHRPASLGRDQGELNSTLSAQSITEICTFVFQEAAAYLESINRPHDAAELRVMTPHSWRHTGITQDLAKGRPMLHVMADAGHQSPDVTARYVGLDRIERYESAKHKGIS